ncbi:glycosyltransferase family 2 protein [Aequorivita sp. CIP111184]|uniref:glycosyltransferase family 2 protein n=1 Tax=Aequorivita sp. CIP111184 TaxID=2211356 RepID=UPI000DBBDB5F|nr:glycosyltransferase family 2 protein [Aequorivita sp. CIP111184]SRX55355.1 Putative glycosyltransferase EpsE [Aequorivita sp. CIP111184]
MKISVYITSYNQKAFLQEAIESVLAQTLQPFEIIIVDDCSSDGSQELIKEYFNKYPFIKYFFHEKNQGVSQVRITALSNVTGDFVTYLDGDDLYLPNKLEIESQLMKNNDCNIVFTNNMYVDPDDVNDVKWIWATDKIKLSSNLFAQTISRDFPRRSLFRMELINYEFLKNIGFHDLNLKIYEDYDLRIRLAKKAKISCSIEPTTKIRISKNGLSRTNREEHIKSYKYIYSKYETDVNNLNESLRNEVKLKMERNLNSLYKQKNEFSNKTLKERIKNKLQILIDKI